MFYLHYFQVPISKVLRNPDKADILIADSLLRRLYMPRIIARDSKHCIRVKINK